MTTSLKPRPFYFRARPPQGGGCSHPYVTGSQVLPDGSFEAANGLGPSGDEIPGFGDVGGLSFPFLNWLNGTDVGPVPPTKWWQRDNSATQSKRWKVSTANPRSGTYHLRQQPINATTRNAIYVSRLYVCPDQYTGNAWEVGQTRVEAGDSWNLSFYAMINSAINNNGLGVWLEFSDQFDSDIEFVGYVLDQTLTTSYTLFTVGGTVPGSGSLGFDPYFMSLNIENRWTPNSGSPTIDLDDVTLSLT